MGDQAAWISKGKADTAKLMLRSGDQLFSYCQPCGDVAPKPIMVKNVRVKYTGSGNYYQLYVNNKGLDLAYVYVNQSGKWTNLAMVLNLPVKGVSKIMPTRVKYNNPDAVAVTPRRDLNKGYKFQIEYSNPYHAVRQWRRSNQLPSIGQSQKIATKYYSGNQKFMKTKKYPHPVIAKVQNNRYVFKALYRGIVTGYDKQLKRSFIVYVPQSFRNGPTALHLDKNRLLIGTQNRGLLKYNIKRHTLKALNVLVNKDIWKITKSGKNYRIQLDGGKPKVLSRRQLR